MNRCFSFLTATIFRPPLIALALLAASFVRADELSLAGTWEVSLTEPHVTQPEWRNVSLPGTLDDAGIGEPLTLKPELTLPVLTRLQRKHTYVGPAWYRREVTIPTDWSGRRIVLELERVLWKSRVWVDGRETSQADSLTTPHRHDLSSALTPGRHELILQIDNREIHRGASIHIDRYEVPENFPAAHAYTNHTQTMWNGVLGQLRLRAEDHIAIGRMAIVPRLGESPRIDLAVTCLNPGAQPVSATIALRLRRVGATATDSKMANIAELRQLCEIPAGGGGVRIDWTLPDKVAIDAWDEFSPTLYQVDATLTDGGSDGSAIVTSQFGFREIAAQNGELLLNGHRIFLRGNLECATFPLTGHPPTDVQSWRKMFEQAKTWGLNHLRFHSWCPPRAAFTAADELGLYLQIELPHWSLEVGKDAETWRFLRDEADRIVAEYGNHPSFLFFAMGNELEGDFTELNTLVRRLRANDPRRLHTVTAFTFQNGHGKAPEPADEYFITQYTHEGWIRGQGVFNDLPPAFDADYRAAAAAISVPLVSHEIGQYAIYPDLREISRYSGNLVPLNFIAVRDDLARKGLLPLAPQFTAASGRFAALLYKEEIERALRTPQLDGFQLLQLQDFPGQGTALVGLLNAFWESKGVVSPEEFREACSPVTPLARFSKAVYERGETFRAKIEVANFFRGLPQAEVMWTVRDARRREIGAGVFGPLSIALGGAREIGEISLPIPVDGDAAQWQLEVAIRGTAYRNHWNLWVYPRGVGDVPAGVRLVTTLAEAQRALAAGERVLFAPPVDEIKGIEGKFVPVFWSPVHFPKQPGTMGLLCDPAHPALREFPTESHSDWQWWDPVLRSRSVVLDGLTVTPIVRVIDNFVRNHSLANVFEARVGDGRLLFCAIDIVTDLEKRPVARQLRASLLRYVASPDFKPQTALTADRLRALIVSKQP
jgi:hypothetical protein